MGAIKAKIEVIKAKIGLRVVVQEIDRKIDNRKLLVLIEASRKILTSKSSIKLISEGF